MSAAKRYKMETKACPSLPDAYNALVGLSVSLRTFVPKSLHRRKLADPQATKHQLEFATREYWLCVWAGMLKEICLPVCTIADVTSDHMAVLRAALGTRRVGNYFGGAGPIMENRSSMVDVASKCCASATCGAYVGLFLCSWNKMVPQW